MVPAKEPARLHWPEYFSFHNREVEFEEALQQIISELIRQARHTIIPERNAQSYRHGRRWISTHSDVSQDESELKTFESSFAARFSEITDRDTGVLINFIETIVASSHKDFVRFMYQYLSEVCSQTGQVVDAKDHRSPALAFLEALKSIQFSVDEDGAISRPQFRGGSEALKRLTEDINNHGQRFQE
jgi:hypothetical protein